MINSAENFDEYFSANISCEMTLAHSPQHVGVCHVKRCLAHAVLGLHVAVVFRQELARLALCPVGCRVHRRPAIIVLDTEVKILP